MTHRQPVLCIRASHLRRDSGSNSSNTVKAELLPVEAWPRVFVCARAQNKYLQNKSNGKQINLILEFTFLYILLGLIIDALLRYYTGSGGGGDNIFFRYCTNSRFLVEVPGCALSLRSMKIWMFDRTYRREPGRRWKQKKIREKAREKHHDTLNCVKCKARCGVFAPLFYCTFQMCQFKDTYGLRVDQGRG